MLLNLFEENIIKTVQKYNMITDGDRIVVGLSGGADSSAMLCALKNICKNKNVTLVAAHLNHGIRGPEAERDELFSKKLADSFDICFVSKTVSVPDYCKLHKVSEEAAGRKFRYDFFEEVCEKYQCNKIAVAHNKNDKAETVIINLIRGAGMSGMCSIPPVNGKIIRPLIETDRADIETYAHDNGIDFVTDSTNCIDMYTRNTVRNQIITKMQCINSNAVNNILRCSAILNEENDFAESYVTSLNAVQLKNNKAYIARNTFENEHRAIKKRLILRAFELFCGTKLNISFSQIDLVLNSAKTGNKFYFFGNTVLTVENEYITLSYISETEEYEYFPTIPGKITVVQTNTAYCFELVSEMGSNKPDSIYLDYDKLEGKKLVLRSKKDGDCFSPSGMTGTKKIKKFFIDNKIPANQRLCYPLLLADGETAAVIPLRVSRNYIIDNNTKNILKITVLGGTDVK